MLRSWGLVLLLLAFAWVAFPVVLPLAPLPDASVDLEAVASQALGEPDHRPVTVRLRPDLAALDWVMHEPNVDPSVVAVAAPFRVSHPGHGRVWVSGRGELLGAEHAEPRPSVEAGRAAAEAWFERLGVEHQPELESQARGELRFGLTGVGGRPERALVRWRGGTVLARRVAVVPQSARDAWRERRELANLLAVAGVALAVLGGGLIVWLARGAVRRWRYGAGVGLLVLAAVLPAPFLQVSRYVEPWSPDTEVWWQVWLAGAGARAGQWSLAALGVGLTLAWVGAMPDGGRGRTFDRVLRGQIDGDVARDLERGLLLTLVLGVAAVLSVGLAGLLGVPPVLQPAHTMLTFYDVEAAWLLVPTFALFAALTEELVYHHGATRVLLANGRSRWLAVLLPAVVYGLIHAPLTFIPPADPIWRVGIATAAGAAWGVAYLRFGALTVVTSHCAADVLIFGWPHVTSGRYSTWLGLAVIASIATLGRWRERSLGQGHDAVAAGTDEDVDHAAL